MTQAAPKQKVIIVGAGLAGLSLAQGLKRANPPVPFHIFERDTSSSFRAQGYRIRISADGAGALQQLLPDNLFRAFEESSAEIVHGGNIINAYTNDSHDFNPPTTRPEGRAYNVDRAVLRTVLLLGLEEHISFGKRFDRYSLTPEGSVDAHFADGSVETGSILIGADGVRSFVRRQFLPDLTVLETEGRAVFGKTYLTPDLESRIHKQVGQGIGVITEGEDNSVKLFCDGMRFNHDASQSLGFALPKDYIYWVLLFREEHVPDIATKLLSLTSGESVSLSRELTKGWHELHRAVLDEQDETAASTLAFYCCTEDDFRAKWELTRKDMGLVTLLGDAAHPMPPVGGVGANSAFQESADLCALLLKAYASSDDELKSIILEYEKRMTERAKLPIQRSAGGAGRLLGIKPVTELKPAKLWS